jgi:hypothetical protein
LQLSAISDVGKVYSLWPGWGVEVYDMIRYDDVNCSWVSTRWQWSINLYTNRKETTMHKRRNNTKTGNTRKESKTYKARTQT